MRKMFLLVLLSCAAPVLATTWYVSPSGNDSNNGKSESKAFLTIQKAVDAAAPNDTVLVAEGAYQYISIPGTKAPLTIQAKGKVEKTFIKGASSYRCVTIGDGSTTNIYVKGFTLTGGKYQSRGAGALGGTYVDCIISNNYNDSTGATAAGAYACTLYNCMISDNICKDWTGGIEKCIASNCVIRANEGHAGVGGAAGCVLIECKISGNSGGGAGNCQLYRCLFDKDTAKTSTAYDCVIVANNPWCIVASKCYNCTFVSKDGIPSIGRDVMLYNCIISSYGTNPFKINIDYETNWPTCMYNCLFNNVSLGANTQEYDCIRADPKFVSDSDFSLQSSSPCINAGNDSYVSTTLDYLGNRRIASGKVDIGACEYRAFYDVSFIIGENAKCINGELNQSIQESLSATLPEIETDAGYWFLGWDKSCENIMANTTINALIAKVDVTRSENDIGLTISDVSGWSYYYTLDGSTPTKDSVKYDGRVSINSKGSHSIRILGISESGAESEVYSYEIAAPATPVITASVGEIFSDMQTITISCETEGAKIYYTLDGSEPTIESTEYRRFRITGKTTVKAIAVVDGQSWSETAVAHYALGRCDNPVILLADGPTFWHSNQEVSISCGAEGILRYTTDGSEPTNESPIYTEPFAISETTVVKAKVFSDSYFDSEVVTATLTREWEQVASPVITAASSFTGSKTEVTIVCATDGATIYYTTDGTEPNSSSPVYSSPIEVAKTCTIKAYAILDDYTDSGVVSWSIEKIWGVGDSVGSPDQVFTTADDLGWVRDMTVSFDGSESMRSGAIENSKESILETKVFGKGTVTFQWKASTEDSEGYFDWDHGEFHAGDKVYYIDAESGWVEVSHTFTTDGEHTLKWIYVKDAYESEGCDCIWMDAFIWTPAPQFTETQTTPVPVPFVWLQEKYPSITDAAAFEAKANEVAANGVNKVWECYVAGIDPTDATAKFVTKIEMVDGKPIITWDPDMNDGAGKTGFRTYKILGSTDLKTWTEVADEAEANFNFFKVEVSMP